MSALNPNNPNGGGKGDSDIASNVPSAVSVERDPALGLPPHVGGNDFSLTQKGDTARPAPKSVNDFDPRFSS